MNRFLPGKEKRRRKNYIANNAYCIASATMSVQVNIRIDEDFLSEIDALAKVMHISRSEYIKLKLAKCLQEDTLNMAEIIALEYARGRITERELENLLGKDAEDVKFVVHHIKRGKREIEEMVKKGLL